MSTSTEGQSPVLNQLGTFYQVSSFINTIDNWELAMRDTGCGVPPELRYKIFDPFVTSGKQNGTGLGLAIVREIVEGHGGAIQLRSSILDGVGSQNSGTTFLIRMPFTPSPKSDRGE